MNNEIQQDKNDLNYFDILHTKEECGCVHEEFYPSDFVRFNKGIDKYKYKYIFFLYIINFHIKMYMYMYMYIYIYIYLVPDQKPAK